MGDLHHLTSDDAHAELGKVISGEKLGRRSAEKITIFDSRGTGIPVLGWGSRLRARVRTWHAT
jgi:alanine dehydrogenase